ncbi:TetR/AcrR family transcriptional regulator [Streptomyces sp. A7024]|uniref:TetR/AcrR family transcriptional regulator n=1 Tax=Streptomyces coryli TaxID=1128680 RepID=A0A6G4UC65_9ACTN|nr:TetR-like C-terminal domain-containing protein [Streptomyces coryli]NGN69825.1 TetR/AcrR family transcriptional regulator [Streptomyces coryli]
MARAGLTTERVALAAADLADEVGLDALTVSALARRLGVRDASLYSHVKSLHDLRMRVAVLAAADFAERLAPELAGRAGADALTAFATVYRSFALERPGRYAATQLPLADGYTSPAGERAIEMTYQMLRDGYALEEPDLTDAVRLLRSTLHGYADLELKGGFGHPREVERSWAQAVRALHVALTNWPCPPTRGARPH